MHRLTEPTNRGLYTVTLSPIQDPPPIGRVHSWVVEVRNNDGEPFLPKQLVVTGGMPGHGHGFPSQPQVTQLIRDGIFQVDGVIFNMGGTWQLLVGVTGDEGPDEAVFNYTILEPPSNTAASLETWTDKELAIIRSLSLRSLQPQSRDQTNRFSGNSAAQILGQQLFFDPGLSAGGDVSCATCHSPEKGFSDGKPLSVGSKPTRRNSPTLMGAAYQDWFYWDGRRDSLWAQSVTPIESIGEMDSTRVDAVRYVLAHPVYRQLYDLLGGLRIEDSVLARLPADTGPFTSREGRERWGRLSEADRKNINRAFSDIGKILAAYVETIRHSRAPFDEFADALLDGDVNASEILGASEIAGLKLFLDSSRTLCLRCHNGPHYTNNGFHNIGSSLSEGNVPDMGRAIGLQAALMDEFNCLGDYSDATDSACTNLKFARADHLASGAFKVPTLRGLASSGPYFHDGRFDTIRNAVEFYTRAPAEDAGPTEQVQVDLTATEIDQIASFLQSLSAQ